MIQFQKPLSWSNTCHHKINIKYIPQKTDNFFDKSYQMIALVICILQVIEGASMLSLIPNAYGSQLSKYYSIKDKNDFGP
jgi:hypothetical protein